MNKKLLAQMKARSEKRLGELRTKLEKNEIREDDIAAVEEEVTTLVEEVQALADEIANLDDTTDDNENTTTEDNTTDENDDATRDDENDSSENRSGMLTSEQRSRINANIAEGLNARGHQRDENKNKQIRSAFAKFVVGQIDETEARSLGIVTGNGSVTVPEIIASEIITYAQEENLLRKYGTVVKTAGDVKYPFLVKKAEANVNKKERGAEIKETDIEFDEVTLDPAEFDALATVTKKLLKMTGAPIEDIVIEELKKAYVRKEINYMFNGDDSGNENPGALAKKAVEFTPSIAVDLTAADAGQKMYDALIEFKNTPVTEVMKKGRFIINRAALTVIEKMKTTDGFPLLRPMTQAESGIGGTLVGYPVEFTDAADKKGEPDTPILYFGDFSAFKIQDVIGAMEIQKLIEKFSGTNKVGFQIYNLLDGQLIYSPFEPAVYKYEIKKVTPPSGGE